MAAGRLLASRLRVNPCPQKTTGVTCLHRFVRTEGLYETGLYPAACYRARVHLRHRPRHPPAPQRKPRIAVTFPCIQTPRRLSCRPASQSWVVFSQKGGEVRTFCASGPAIQEQTIQFTVDNPSTREIVKAQITVHGLSHKGRFVPLADGPAPDLSRKVSVVLDVKGNSRASSDLSLSRFASVTSVDLNALTYADGATWRASLPGACSVVPDPFMLVSAAR